MYYGLGEMSTNNTAGLHFLQPGTTMNGAKNLDFLKDQLNNHMIVHDRIVFMQDGAPCHRSKPVNDYFLDKNVDVLDMPGNNPDINIIENLWDVTKSCARSTFYRYRSRITEDNHKNSVD